MKVIYTSAEEDWKHWQLVKPTFEAYAERCGAELVNLPKSKWRNPQWVLWDALETSTQDAGDDLAVWIDSDIVISDDAPDLFISRYTQGRFMVCEPSYPARVHPMWRDLWRKTTVPNPRPYPITGIASWSQRYVEPLVKWMEENEHKYLKKMGDQELLAVALFDTNTPFWFYPPDWHRMKNYITATTPFMHAAGGRKLKVIRKFLEL